MENIIGHLFTYWMKVCHCCSRKDIPGYLRVLWVFWCVGRWCRMVMSKERRVWVEAGWWWTIEKVNKRTSARVKEWTSRRDGASQPNLQLFQLFLALDKAPRLSIRIERIFLSDKSHICPNHNMIIIWFAFRSHWRITHHHHQKEQVVHQA